MFEWYGECVSLGGIGRFFSVGVFWGGGVFGLVSLIVVGGGLVLVLTSCLEDVPHEFNWFLSQNVKFCMAM